MDGAAQLFSASSDRFRSVQSLTVGYSDVSFAFDGATRPAFTFDFEDAAYGLVYTQPHLHASFARGTSRAQGRDLTLVDAVIATWGSIQLRPVSTSRRRVSVPVMLHTSFRRVATEQEQAGDVLEDDFNVTVIGLGTGLGLQRQWGMWGALEARGTPVIGLAARALDDALGHAWIIDVDVQFHLLSLRGRYGLTVGYGFRDQTWNVRVSDLFPDVAKDLFDYRGRQHTLRAGLNW